jgi:hypothetical protein
VGNRGTSKQLMSVAVLTTTLALIGGSLAFAGGVAHAAPSGVQPRATGELDCNGFSRIQKTLKPTLACMDPRTNHTQRFEDNGHYIGHDEPTVRFVSNKPGTGNDFNITETIGKDPAADPTVAHPGADVTHYFELSVAPWFSMSLCDPNSFPETPCTPKSDANAPSGTYPGAGGAFLELQFYAPGFAPFVDSVSCDNTHWCSALNIDSLECTAGGTCNNSCIEPVNFAYIQTNGVPTGPPSAQLTNLATFTPNRKTLLMNPGDKVNIHIFDAAVPGGHALETAETDLTTGQSGYMIASAANGFMNTSIADCTGTPFNFEPEYNTDRAQNLLPWGAGPYAINSQFEIGHFEPCTTVTGRAVFTMGRFTDTYARHCVGPYETSADGGGNHEPGDAPCYNKGDTHGGTVPPNLVTGCDVFFSAVGDLDYDGSNYVTDWPDSVTPDSFPGSFLQSQPTSGGRSYESIQLETDNAATQHGCNLSNGHGCVMPPPGAAFYPYWTLARVGGQCVWEFGQMRNGNTFGGDAQYGAVTSTSLGAFTGPIQRNPGCG